MGLYLLPCYRVNRRGVVYGLIAIYWKHRYVNTIITTVEAYDYIQDSRAG